MPSTTVIYNNTCPICSREIALYQREAEQEELDIAFCGVTETDLAAHGLDRESAARRLHVVHNGELLDGFDAFVALWRSLPRWAWLARLVDRPVLRPVARTVYDLVAAPLLYRMDRRRRRRANVTP